MKDTTSQVGLAAVLVAAFSAHAAAQLAVRQPTFSLEAVAVNGVPVKENTTGEITAYRGDVILCETVKSHLKLLSQVSHLVNKPAVRELLRGQPPRTQLMETIGNAFPQAD